MTLLAILSGKFAPFVYKVVSGFRLIRHNVLLWFVGTMRPRTVCDGHAALVLALSPLGRPAKQSPQRFALDSTSQSSEA
jgi:hypothetical protein